MMEIRMVLFARLRETLGTAQESLPLPPDVATVGALVDWLGGRGTAWREQLAPGRAVRFAVNQEMADRDTPLRDGDEVAIFPPVTGG